MKRSLTACLGVVLLCCRSNAPPPALVAAAAAESAPLVAFAFESIDARLITSDAMRGRPVMLIIGMTWDLTTQAMMPVLTSLARESTHVQFALVMIQDADRELVELYAANLHVPFPTGLTTLAGISALPGIGPLTGLPQLILMDGEGRLRWRKSGMIKASEIRPHLSLL